jgi:Ni,Fe-hydrogenase III large subunit
MKVVEGEAVSRVEAPRGELIYFIKTNGKEGLSRLKVRTPTLANVAGLKSMLVGGEIADIPVVIASIDPCMSCTNRITIIDEGRGEARELDCNTLRRKPS